MNKKTLTKLFAGILAFILVFTNFSILGSYSIESIASSIKLEKQDTKVGKTNLEFDAYFLNEGEEIHSQEINVMQNGKIYLKINAIDGYLKDGVVSFKDANFSVAQTKNIYIQNIDEETNTITLNQIDKGESVVLEIAVSI